MISNPSPYALGSHVHHMPGGGVRFAHSEFVDIIDNEVDNNSRKSYSGTHGLVVTYTVWSDTN